MIQPVTLTTGYLSRQGGARLPDSLIRQPEDKLAVSREALGLLARYGSLDTCIHCYTQSRYITPPRQ